MRGENVIKKTGKYILNYVLNYEWSLILFFTFLMALSAHIRILLPFTPVPITLQTFVLYISIGFLRKKAFWVQLAYILLGIGGVSVFSRATTGIGYLAGPTGGYLVGFLVVSLVCPYFLRKSYKHLFVLFLLANVIIYFLGGVWLICLYRYSFLDVWKMGVCPFLIGDIFKILVACPIIYRFLR